MRDCTAMSEGDLASLCESLLDMQLFVYCGRIEDICGGAKLKLAAIYPQYVEEEAETPCMSDTGPGGFYCTREHRHPGPHVAVGAQGALYGMWLPGWKRHAKEDIR